MVRLLRRKLSNKLKMTKKIISWVALSRFLAFYEEEAASGIEWVLWVLKRVRKRTLVHEHFFFSSFSASFCPLLDILHRCRARWDLF